MNRAAWESRAACAYHMLKPKQLFSGTQHRKTRVAGSMPFNHHVTAMTNTPSPFPPLESIDRPTVPTNQAAYYLDRRPQTLRIWAMRGHPIRPLYVHGRLAWPVSSLRRLLGLELSSHQPGSSAMKKGYPSNIEPEENK